jgi:hypothetical protein
VARSVRSWLTSRGWPEAVGGDSGNGAHLIYAIDLPNDDESRDLIRDFLHAVGDRFDTDRAKIDRGVFNAGRITKLFGTWARKGPHTAERPHRLARLTHVPEVIGVVTPEQIADVIAEVAEAEEPPPETAEALDRLEAAELVSPFRLTATSGADARTRAVAYLKKCEPAISGKRGHSKTMWAARCVVRGFKLGPDVGFDVLSVHHNPFCQPPWSDAELRHKCKDAHEKPFNKPPGWLLNEQASDSGKTNGSMAKDAKAKAPGGPEAVDPELLAQVEDTADLDDVAKDGASIEWTWDKWMARGSLTGLLSNPGVGKTRLGADLVRRIRKVRLWPDGSEITLPADAPILWIPADANHAELTDALTAMGVQLSSVKINTTKEEPYGGTDLDDPTNMKLLDLRIARFKPALVIVDTIGSATVQDMCKQEDANRFFKPLRNRALKHGVTILVMAHLNAQGTAYGRRIEAHCRQVLRLTKPDPDQEDRRRLEVVKSNKRFPAPLGVTMGRKATSTTRTRHALPRRARRGGPSRQRFARRWIG